MDNFEVIEGKRRARMWSFSVSKYSVILSVNEPIFEIFESIVIIK